MRRFLRVAAACAGVIGIVAVAWSAAIAFDSPAKKGASKTAKKQDKKPDAPKLPPLKAPEDKLKFLEVIRQSFPAKKYGSEVAFSPADLDKSLELRIGLPEDVYAKPIGDEGFLRRAYLDLTGRVPDSKAIADFTSNSDPRKRAKVIDQLLETKEYARHWGHYWRNVIFFNAPVKQRNKVNPQALEDWFAEEFAKNSRWDRIVSELISATPKFNKDKPKENQWNQDYGPNNFVLAYENDPPDIASQTARVFMGINIQCAECHDHPFDKWKREQFHELAAFFAPGKYYMTNQEDPTKKTEMQARFLLGEKPPDGLKPDALRVAVAAYLVYNPDNYWFARAYVNRIWNELVGDGFYSVDSLGPDKDCIHPIVVNRLAALFRYRDFNVQWVFRTLMNSEAYQREIRTIADQKELFTAVRPARLRPDQVVASVEQVTGKLENRVQRKLSQTFDADPSRPQADLEGSMQQALLLMNSPQLQKQVEKSGLRAELQKTKNNEQLLHKLYLGTLARHATAAEIERGTKHLKQTSDRNAAIDDLLWVVMNSTEFVTKR